MKKVIILILSLLLICSFSGCNNEPPAVTDADDDISVSIIMSEMEMGKDEAQNFLGFLKTLGLDDEIDNIYYDEDGDEAFYKIWYGLNYMKIFYDGDDIVKVVKNTKQIFPRPESDTETTKSPASETPLKPVESKEPESNGIELSAKPTEAPTAPPSDMQIVVVSLTSPITRGKKAALTIRGIPNTEYDISVIYASGESSAAGLEPKISDRNGEVSWSWRVGNSVKPGDYLIRITSGENVYETTFTVTEAE